MGFYYQTVFYKNYFIENETEKNSAENCITLADLDNIIEYSDVEKGYVSTEELLKFFGEKIQLSDITENSRIVEYETCTLTDDTSAYMRKNLPIKSDKDYILK